MAENKCAICLACVDDESAPILTISGYGMPRYLCPECEELVDTASGERDLEKIDAAISELASRMTKSVNVDDQCTFDAVKDILDASQERAERIKDGTWDFSGEEAGQTDGENEGDELPPELCETDEDRILDKKDEESLKKFDKIVNWISIAIGAFALAFFIWRFFF